tara:strand:+ start:111 stop:941 length:831 start_codon:yes stop_codon:yes gene_type:complete
MTKLYQTMKADHKIERTQNRIGELRCSLGNSKLKKTGKAVKALLSIEGSLNGFTPRGYEIASFNLPAGGYQWQGLEHITCPKAGPCLPLCYARAGHIAMDDALGLRIANHQTLLTLHGDDMIQGLDAMVKALPTKIGLIRIHDSGDFYALYYMKAWIEVAKLNPTILFYGYTKSISMLHSVALPDNMRVSQSLGGKEDHLVDYSLSHARIFTGSGSTKAERNDDGHRRRIEAGYIDGNDEVDGDLASIMGENRIGLVYHGMKNLTDAQTKHFQKAV